MQKYPYKLVALGGTFDRFHKGHESLLIAAFEKGARVVAGITDEHMTRGKILAPLVESYDKRHDAVQRFLSKKNLLSRAELVKITDPYGPVARRKDIEAVIVGPRFSKEAVNKLKKYVDILQCPIVHMDNGRYLSSTSIRLGRVNRTGQVYRLFQHTISLPEKARSYLKKPLGIREDSLPKFTKQTTLIAVGDETVRRFIESGRIPDISIVDFHVQRKPLYSSLTELGFGSDTAETVVKNPAGTLTPSLARAVRLSLSRMLLTQKPQVIRVVGEEDLATLLAILYAPLSSIVCYGQPPLRQGFEGQANEGVVVVEVTEQKKEEIASLLSTFTPR